MHIVETNEAILCAIANSLKKELPTGTSFSESYDSISKTIEITATKEVIKLLDSFLLRNRIVAIKRPCSLTIQSY